MADRTHVTAALIHLMDQMYRIVVRHMGLLPEGGLGDPTNKDHPKPQRVQVCIMIEEGTLAQVLMPLRRAQASILTEQRGYRTRATTTHLHRHPLLRLSIPTLDHLKADRTHRRT